MPASTFRLQPLIKLREAKRDQRREALAKAYQAEQILQRQIDQTVADRTQAYQQLQSMTEPGELNVDQMLAGHRYQMILKLQQQQLQQQQGQLREEIEKRRAALMEADRELKILEKLRERKEADQRMAEQRFEIRQLDEVALRGYQLPDPDSSS